MKKLSPNIILLLLGGYLSLLPLFLNAQFATLPLNQMERQWYENELLRQSVQLHTAVLPWRATEVQEFSRKSELLPDSLLRIPGVLPWLKRKALYENFLSFRGEDFEVNLNPVLHFSGGREQESPDYERIYRNSRGLHIAGQIGERFSFYSTVVENLGRFAAHINQLAQSQEVVPGMWRTKPFRDNASDFGYAAGEVAYSTKKYFHFRLGRGKQFIGEGHRSMLLSDNSVNAPFFRIETTIGRVKYVNHWALMNDIRPEIAPEEDVFAKKFLSMHYLSVNIGKRGNLGLFEGLMWGDELQRYGFDPNFLNPVILFRPVEFSQGFRGGNILMGLTGSYLSAWGIKAYGQLVIDEFNLDDVLNWSEGSRQNLFAWQLGLKWGDALGVRNLFLRAEYNAARPYTYGHRDVVTNWSHYGQALAHPLGGNFNELIMVANYRNKRWSLHGQIQRALVGRDNAPEDHRGGDIFKPTSLIPAINGVFIGNGIRSNITNYRLEIAYIANPFYNLRTLIGWQSRVEDQTTLGLPNSQTLYLGVRTDMYDLHQDY